MNEIKKVDEVDIELLELEGFTRSIAEIEWLQLILVLLYYVSPGVDFRHPFGVFISIVCFAAFVISFHYINFFTIPSKWKIAIETWAMLFFVSWVIISSGEINSPLLSLYVLTIIACALTLGKLVTFLEIGLIAAVYVFIHFPYYNLNGISVQDLSSFMSAFVPVILIAYVTTMLAADVQHGKKALKLLAETDDSTGFKNKRAFNKSLETEYLTAQRYSRNFSVMMIDADNLKETNDTFGHGAGDRLIMLIASIIKDNLRAADVISRYGGDEFLVLLPETEPRQAREAAEKVRLAIQNAAFDMNGNQVRTTVSIGIAGFPADTGNKEVLLDCADKALYESKLLGRNRTTLYSDLIPRSA
jgi:diguanylate cyclase (GGDEF)-like protein